MGPIEYNQIVGKRLKNAMEARQMTQTDICSKCSEQGLNISQSSLSRMLSGSDKMDIYKIATVCKVLGVHPNDVLSFGSSESANIVEEKKDSSFITNASDKKFKGYLGKYYGYFYSTENNDTIHEGEFRLYPDQSTGNCCASFRFETGKTDVNNEPVCKEFIGTAKLSDTLGAICCELTSKDEHGDASYIIFKYHYIENQQCECRIGMVVTICAGLKRLPVSHKLLICRQKLTDADRPFIAGQLKLNDDTILVSESDYHDFIKDPLLPESFKSYFDNDNDLFKRKAANLIFYSFREDDVLDTKSISHEDKVRVINLLRKYSNAKRCKKVGPKSEDYIFSYLMDRKKKMNPQGIKGQ